MGNASMLSSTAAQMVAMPLMEIMLFMIMTFIIYGETSLAVTDAKLRKNERKAKLFGFFR
jgi:hypothetical protein